MRLFALFFLLGTLLIQTQQQLPSNLWIAIILCCSLLLLLFLKSKYSFNNTKLRPIALNFVALSLVAFFSGLLLSVNVAQNQLNNRLLKQYEGKDIILQGLIADIPQKQQDGVRFRLDVQQAYFPDDKNNLVSVKGLVRLGWFRQEKDINAGETWQFRVRLKRPSGFINPSGFDYEKWLFTERITATGYIRVRKDAWQEQSFKLADSPWWSVNRLRQNIHYNIQNQVNNKNSAAVLSALVVAVRSRLNDTQWVRLQQTGTSHLIAISGLHIAVVAGFAFLPILLLWHLFPRLNEKIPLRVAGTISSVIFASIYAMLAGFTLPTQRALLMVIIAMLGLVSRRNFHASSILASALLAVLILDPLAAMTVSFWLSFLAVSLILLFLKRQLISPNYQLIKLQFVLSFGMLPLTLFFFNSVSLSSPLANLLAIPWVSFIVVPLSLLATIMMPLSNFISGALLNIASLSIELLFQGLYILSNSPLSNIQLAEIPSYYLLIAFLGLLFLLLPKGFPARWLALFSFLPVLLFSAEKPETNNFSFTLLDVGQGMASVIQTKNHTLVYDTGTRLSASYDIGKLVLVPFLKAKGIKQVDTLILSHDDIDHTGGSNNVLKSISVATVLASYPLSLKNHVVDYCNAGMKWHWDGVSFEILSPFKDYEESDNNLSCVLRIANKHHSLLLTGDIEKKTERLLLERLRLKNNKEKLRSNVLSVPHHGSKTSSTDAFIKAVSPEIALIPVGYRNRFGHPKDKVLARYQKNKIQLFDTVKHGAITIHFPDSKKSLSLKLAREERRGFWSR